MSIVYNKSGEVAKPSDKLGDLEVGSVLLYLADNEEAKCLFMNPVPHKNFIPAKLDVFAKLNDEDLSRAYGLSYLTEDNLVGLNPIREMCQSIVKRHEEAINRDFMIVSPDSMNWRELLANRDSAKKSPLGRRFV